MLEVGDDGCLCNFGKETSARTWCTVKEDMEGKYSNRFTWDGLRIWGVGVTVLPLCPLADFGLCGFHISVGVTRMLAKRFSTSSYSITFFLLSQFII